MKRYKYYEYSKQDSKNNEIKVVKAVGRHNGKDISAVASCYFEDTYNLEDGKKLAGLRLREKICKKRVKQTEHKLEYLEYMLSEVLDALTKTDIEYEKQIDEFENVSQELAEFEKELSK